MDRDDWQLLEEGLVDPDWLRKQLENEADTGPLVILDVRFDLQDPRWGRQQYAEGHVPHAVYLALEYDLAAPKQQHGGRHPLPPLQRLAETFGKAGVGNQSAVVLYDQGSGEYAARAWWLLRWLGHSAVALLDGGWAGWRAAGGAVSHAPVQPKVQPFVAHPQEGFWVDTDYILHRPADALLIDARAPQRYRGEIEPIDPVAGHIPGALNFFWEENKRSDGRWKTPQQLQERFAPLLQAKEILSYCGSGVTACANLFALFRAGYRQGRLYPGGWSDWISYPNLPRAVGPAPGSSEALSQ